MTWSEQKVRDTSWRLNEMLGVVRTARSFSVHVHDDAAMLSKNIYFSASFHEISQCFCLGVFCSFSRRRIKNVYNNLWYWRNLLFGHDKQIKMQIIIKLYIVFRWLLKQKKRKIRRAAKILIAKIFELE